MSSGRTKVVQKYFVQAFIYGCIEVKPVPEQMCALCAHQLVVEGCDRICDSPCIQNADTLALKEILQIVFRSEGVINPAWFEIRYSQHFGTDEKKH